MSKSVRLDEACRHWLYETRGTAYSHVDTQLFKLRLWRGVYLPTRFLWSLSHIAGEQFNEPG